MELIATGCFESQKHKWIKRKAIRKIHGRKVHQGLLRHRYNLWLKKYPESRLPEAGKGCCSALTESRCFGKREWRTKLWSESGYWIRQIFALIQYSCSDALLKWTNLSLRIWRLLKPKCNSFLIVRQSDQKLPEVVETVII